MLFISYRFVLYMSDVIMNNKLEQRIKRLEKVMSRKNQQLNKSSKNLKV